MRALTRAGALVAAALFTVAPIVLAVPASATVPAAAPVVASERPERELVGPEGKGILPKYRPDGASLLVCGTDKADIDARVANYPTDLRVGTLSLWTQCQTGGYRTVQDAVNNVKAAGATVKILPGLYVDQPFATAPPAGGSTACVGLPAVLTYAQQVACPTVQNTVGVIGKTDLQIEGVGIRPEDTVLDAAFNKPYVVRADRSPGLYLRNFVAQHATSTAVYVLESDGFALDNVVGRWNDEYGLRMLASDHGVASDCAGYGNGSAGIAVGATPDIDATQRYTVSRYTVEIKHCDGHDNLVGFVGSAANSVWVHESLFANNTVGVSVDSASKVPFQPQNHVLFEKNEIGANNRDYYGLVRDGTCAKPSAQRGYEKGSVCPTRGMPKGTGVVAFGGNDNTWRENWIYDNQYAGFVQTWAPATARGESKVVEQVDNAHHNRVIGNKLGEKPNGDRASNGVDYWWDGQGVANCWQAATTRTVPRVMPRCGSGDLPTRLSTARYLPEPAQALALYRCTRYDLAAQRVPTDCAWYGATGFGRLESKVVLGGAIMLGVSLVIAWWRLARSSALGLGGATLVMAGLVVGVYAALSPTSPLSGIGLLVLGAGWFVFGTALRKAGSALLGWLTTAMGLFAFLGGIDHLLYALPALPVPPSVIRVGLEVVWVPAILISAIALPVPVADPLDLPPSRLRRRPRRPRGPRDPLERFAAALRD